MGGRSEPSTVVPAIEESQRYAREGWPDLALADKLP